MKCLIFFFMAIIAFGLMIQGCENADPLSPETRTDEQVYTLAKVTQVDVPVSGMNYIESAALPERSWFSDGIHHIRDYLLNVTVDGDLVGTATFMQSSNWDEEYNGVVQGPYCMEVECTADGILNGLCGTFSGIYKAKVEGFYTTGRCVLQGSGDFEGLRMVSYAEGPLGGPLTYSGHILGVIK